MSELGRIRDQLKRAMEGEAWHGPALLETIARFDAARAVRRPADDAHNAVELVRHITTWIDTVRERLQGVATQPSAAQDWPASAGPAAAQWDTARDSLRAAYRRLLDAISAMNDDQLDSKVPGKSYTNYFMLHGIIQHTLYHAGQLILLERLLHTPDRTLRP